ncbi:MAG: O-antigen ligase family protein [bacterium]|nr:O-antigen ligase family protein [bacterium]
MTKPSAYKSAILWAARIGIFAVPFIPLIVASPLFFPFITGKNFAFRIIVEIIFACWALLAIADARFRPKKSPLLWSVVTFLCVVFIADALAENPFKAFWSNFERMEGFITLIHLGAYFLVATSVLDSEKLWHRFLATSVGVSAFLGIYGMLQLAGKIVINQGGVRLDGTFGNAAYFAGYMLFHFFLTLFLIFRHRIPLTAKWLYGGALFLQLFVLYFSATRGSAVGLVGGLAVCALLIALFEKHSKKLRIGAIALLLFLTAVSSALYFGKDNAIVRNNPVLERFSSISVEAAGPRFMVWGMAWEGFKERPLFGWGQEGFNNVFNKYYNPDMWGQEQWFDRTHNIFFDWLISAGFLGLLSYLSFFAFLLWCIWESKGEKNGGHFSLPEKSVLTGLLVAYIFHNFFVFDNLVSYILFFSFIAYVHHRSGKPFPVLTKLGEVHSEQARYTSAAVALVLLVGVVYVLNARAMGVSFDLINGLKSQQKGVTENLVYYKRAFAHETVGTQEVAEQAMQSAMNVSQAASIPKETKDQFVSFAVQAMEREMSRAPNDARLRMFIGGFYNRSGQYEAALPHLLKAHELSPNKQTISFELANTYLTIGKFPEALSLLKQAFESAPDFANARIAYTAAAIYAKEFDTADALIASSPDGGIATDERLIKAYYEAKRYDKAAAMLQVRLKQDPNDVQSHISLAAAYLLSGNRQGAISELQIAVTLNPDFKQQGEFYINEIKAGRNP